jgi:diguanylate cyclase (GGDEF)-like protein
MLVKTLQLPASASFRVRSNRIALRDAAVVIALCVAAWFVIEQTDTCTRFFQYVAAHPDTELDSVLLAGILSSLGAFAFAWRRWVEAARAERASNQLANRDALTGLPNRRAFTAHLEAAAKQGRSSFACLLLDLDNFKQVNDLRGHVTGDRLLQSVAARINAAAPHVAVARIGADEFALLAGSEMNSAELAQRIIETVAAPLHLDGHAVRVSVSIGISRFPKDAESADGLLRKADMALYRAKAKGRGHIQAFEKEMEECDRRHAEVAETLNGALSRGEVVPHYQPLIDLKTGDVVGFEVLSRWESGALGTVTPNEFIPIATEAGLIDQLTCKRPSPQREEVARPLCLVPQCKHADGSSAISSSSGPTQTLTLTPR